MNKKTIEEELVERSHRQLNWAREAGALVVVYVMAIFWPMILADGEGHEPAFGWSCAAGVLLIGLFTKDGVAEWKRGRRGPLVFKVLVPLGLLLVSCVLWWTGWWTSSLRSIRDA